MVQQNVGGQETAERRTALWECLQGHNDPNNPLHLQIMEEIRAAGIKTPVDDRYSCKAGGDATGAPHFDPLWLLPGRHQTSDGVALSSLVFEDHPSTRAEDSEK